jgi:DNA-binding HxlR family transcriptional regulator
MAAQGATARPYGSQQRCPVARTLDVVGDRWTILVLRELAFGARRFGELERNLGGIPPAVLTARLHRLEGAGLAQRVPYEDRPARFRYELTAAGRDFVPVLRALAHFGDRHLPRAGRDASDRPVGP